MPDLAGEFQPRISLLTAMTDPRLFGRVFSAPSFWTWRTVAKLIDGTPLNEERELDLFKQCTGRTQPLNRHGRRALFRLVILAGRRAGKIDLLPPSPSGAQHCVPIGAAIFHQASRPSSFCSAPIRSKP
jgi:hypothetical protein